MTDNDVENALKELATTVADGCRRQYASPYNAEEVDPDYVRDNNLDPKGTAYALIAFGSNCGPPADEMIAEEIGLSPDEYYEGGYQDWNFGDELERLVYERLPEGGYVFWHDNELHWELFEEESDNNTEAVE